MARIAKSSEEIKSEDDIDRMKMPKLFSLCKDNNIPLGNIGNNSMVEMQRLLKGELCCSKQLTLDKVTQEFQREALEDEMVRMTLANLFQEAVNDLDHVLGIENGIRADLKQRGYISSKELREKKDAIKNAKAPILILGETGAGKSSFINLLLGKKWLPTSILSNTHVVCEIMYDAEPRLKLVGKNSNEQPKNIACKDEEEFRKTLARHIQIVEEGGSHYNKAEIYLPCDILKAGLVIVDSPGIGENNEMKELVLNYATSACAFIFMINLMAAGGLQQRMSNFLREIYQKAMKDQKWLKTESCIFVCNKWDDVPHDEKKAVKADTDGKIKEFDEFKECKVFMMSTSEADFILRKTTDRRLSPKFLTVLQEIQRLIPIGRTNLVRKEYEYLEGFVGICLYCINTHLSNVGKSKEDKQKKHKDVESKLKSVEKGIKQSFEDQKMVINSKIEMIANSLREHMKLKTTREAICKFTSKDLPKETNWDFAAAEVRHQVYLKIMKEISKWEENKRLFEETAAEVNEALTKEFPKFEKEINEAQCTMTGQKRKMATKDAGEEEVEFVPDFLKKFYQNQKIGTGLKIATSVAASPLFVVGALIRAPVYGFLSLKKSFGKILFSRDFSKAKNVKEKISVCEEYARKVVEHICSTVDFKSVVNEDMQPMLQYVDNHQENLQTTIRADQELSEKLKNDMRTDEEIKEKFKPLEKRFEELKRKTAKSKSKTN